MSIRCINCGGIAEQGSNMYLAKCRSCGSIINIEKPLENKDLINYEVATNNLTNQNFQSAKELFDKILNKNEFLDCYWGAFLAEYGINLKKINDKTIPIFYKISSSNVYENFFFKKALTFTSQFNEKDYYNIGEKIEKIRTKINSLIIEKNYDVFVSYLDEDFALATKIADNLPVDKKIYFNLIKNKNFDDIQYLAETFSALYSSKTLIFVCSNEKEAYNEKYSIEWARFNFLHPGKNIINICSNAYDLPTDLQKQYCLSFNSNYIEEINRILSFSNNENLYKTIIGETKEIKKVISSINKKINEEFIDSDIILSQIEEDKNLLLQISNYCSIKNFDLAQELIMKIQNKHTPEYYLHYLLIKFEAINFDSLLNTLTKIDNIESDQDFLKLLNSCSSNLKESIKKIFKTKLNYILAKEMDFAKNSTIIDGNLLDFSFNDVSKDVFMCQEIHTVKSNSMLVFAKNFVFSNSVKCIEGSVFNKTSNNMSGFIIKNVYVPKSVTKIYQNAFCNNLSKECKLCFETKYNFDFQFSRFIPKIAFNIKPYNLVDYEKVFSLFPTLEDFFMQGRKKIKEYIEEKNKIEKQKKNAKNNEFSNIQINSNIQNPLNLTEYDNILNEKTSKILENDELHNDIVNESLDNKLNDKEDNTETKNEIPKSNLVLVPNEIDKNFDCSLNTLFCYHGNKKVVKIPEGIKIISMSAFSNNAHIEKIIMPDSVINIEENSFSNMPRLKEIELSNNLKLIPFGAFRNSISLSILKGGKKIERIETCAFENCKKLTKMLFYEKLAFINKHAFKNCKNLLYIKFLSKHIDFEGFSFFGSNKNLIIDIPFTDNVSIFKANYDVLNYNVLSINPQKLRVERSINKN